MMEAISLSEKLLFNTVRINQNGSSGTGFFFQFDISNNKSIVIVTNKHVVQDQKECLVKFDFHYSSDITSTNSNETTQKVKWFFHPDDKVDLCCCLLKDLINVHNIFSFSLCPQNIPEQPELEKLYALESVTMVGYPSALWDDKHCLPIFRKGFTATHPAIDFYNDDLKISNSGFGLVDMACFQGSSGSPIMIVNEGMYSAKNGNSYIKDRLIFLGILSSSLNRTALGDIKMIDVPTAKIPFYTPREDLNIGVYIKSRKILDFSDIVLNCIHNV